MIKHTYLFSSGDGLSFIVVPQSDVIRKPQGQIEVSATSSIFRGDGKQVLQVFKAKIKTSDTLVSPPSFNVCFYQMNSNHISRHLGDSVAHLNRITQVNCASSLPHLLSLLRVDSDGEACVLPEG